MICKDWRQIKLVDAIEINPRLSIKKGTLTKKVSMQKLAEFDKKIQSFEITPFTSGTKFQNGDTLLARITPCLENGKTAYVDILDENEIAFGSTEFIILRERKGITDKRFIYYLSISPGFRNIAIKSMTGSSGRQRVQTEVLANTILNLPSLEEQQRIANLLSALDEKVELNNNMNKTLEEISQVLFEQWFLNFEFPNGNRLPYNSNGGKFVDSEIGPIPKDWCIKDIEEIAEIVSKGTTPTKKDIETALNSSLVKFIKVKDINDNGEIGDSLEEIPRSVHEGKLKRSILKKGDILYSIAGTIGRVSYVNDHLNDSNINQAVAFIRLKDNSHFGYIYSQLKGKEAQRRINSKIVQAVQANVSLGTLKSLKFPFPSESILKSFNNIYMPLFLMKESNSIENKKLVSIRNSLLPKLMAGEIRIPDAEKEVEECLQKSN